MRGDGLQARGDGRADQLREVLGERAFLEAGDDADVGEAKVARDAEHRRVADRIRQRGAGLDRGVRFGGQHHQVDALDHVLVAVAAHSDLERPLLGPLRVARADVDVLAEQAQLRSERAPEGAGAADDGDLHLGVAAVSSTASASRRLASASLISVRVTIVRIPASSSASASSTTSASINPL